MVKLWSLETGAELLSLTCPGGTVVGLGTSSDGATLAAASSTGQVVRWTVGEEKVSVELPELGFGMAWLPDSRALALLGPGGKCTVCDTHTTKAIDSFTAHGFISFHPDGKSYVTSVPGVPRMTGVRRETYQVVIREPVSHKVLRTLGPQTDFMDGAHWISDGSQLVVTSSQYERDAKIWDVNKATEVRGFKLMGNASAVHASSLRMASTYWAGTSLIDMKTGSVSHHWKNDIRIGLGEEVMHSLAFSENGERLVGRYLSGGSRD